MSNKRYTEEDILKTLAEKTGESVEDLKKQLDDFVETFKKTEQRVEVEKLSPENLRIIARNQFSTKKLREARSPAIQWQGMIIGIGDKIDTVARARAAAFDAFEKNPMASTKGVLYKFKGIDIPVLVKTEDILNGDTGKLETKVVPLYPKTEGNDKFKRTGKPLPDHNYIRTVVGIAAPVDKKTHVVGPPQIFEMTLDQKGKQYAVNAKDIPMFKPVVFQGIDKTNDENKRAGEYRIGSSTYTEFKVEPTLGLPPVETILESGCITKFVTLGELDEYHDKNEKDVRRWCVTVGNVDNLDLIPNEKTKNLKMRLGDESLMFAKGDEGSFGVLCWIPTDRAITIDFAQDSRVYIVNKTSRGKKYDRENKVQLDEPGDVTLNAYGIYCPEIFKVSAEVLPVGESTLSPTGDTKEDWSDPDSTEDET